MGPGAHRSSAPHLPQSLGDGLPLLSLFCFKELVPRSLRRTLLGHKAEKSPIRKIYTHFKKEEKVLNDKFSKIIALSKGRRWKPLSLLFNGGEISPLFIVCICPHRSHGLYNFTKIQSFNEKDSGSFILLLGEHFR